MDTNQPATAQGAASSDTGTATALATPPAPAATQLSVAAWLAIFCWPLVVGAGTIIYTGQKSNERMETLIASRPDIAVVDDVQLIKLAIDNGAERYSPMSVIDHIGQIVRKNGMEDTILLSKSMVMYTPESKRLLIRDNSGVAPQQQQGWVEPQQHQEPKRLESGAMELAR